MSGTLADLDLACLISLQGLVPLGSAGIVLPASVAAVMFANVSSAFGAAAPGGRQRGVMSYFGGERFTLVGGACASRQVQWPYADAQAGMHVKVAHHAISVGGDQAHGVASVWLVLDHQPGINFVQDKCGE